MIIPTADFDPLFAEDGESFRMKMLRYIESEFADLLEGRQHLLRTDSGLEQLSAAIDPAVGNVS